MPIQKTKMDFVNFKLSALRIVETEHHELPKTFDRTNLVIVDFGFHTKRLQTQCPDDLFYLDGLSDEIAQTVDAYKSNLQEALNDMALRATSLVADGTLTTEAEFRAFYEAHGEQLKEYIDLDLMQWHGTGLVYIAQAPEPIARAFPGVTGFAPHVRLRALHLDPMFQQFKATAFPDEVFQGKDLEVEAGSFEEADDVTPNYRIEAVVSGLARIADACAEGELAPGDVIVLPMSAERDGHTRPLHLEPDIERMFHFLTVKCGLVVVVAAGNKFLKSSEELDQGQNGLKDGCPSSVLNAGTTCGAILVAEDRLDDEKARLKGYRWIDAFLDVNTGDDLDLSGLSDEEKDHVPQIFQTNDGNYKTSASAMAVGALLATVQEARRRRHLDPLKPYEARAHLRQWRCDPQGSRHSCPDALGWLIGTQVFPIGPDNPVYEDNYVLTYDELRNVQAGEAGAEPS